MKSGVDTDLPPRYYAIFIVSRWGMNDKTIAAAREIIEMRIESLIEKRGPPKTTGQERKYLASAVLSLSMTRSASDAIAKRDPVADLFEPWMDR